jgi:hypothetical protein
MSTALGDGRKIMQTVAKETYFLINTELGNVCLP